MAVTPDSVVPGTRLLIVEDEPAIQDMLAMSLAFVGYEVLRASTGAEAVAHADRQKIDLALLDVMLPDTDGVDLLRRLRKVHPDMAAVFVTARDALEDRLAGLTLGGDDYVTKPFSLEEVVARVGVVLRRTRPTRDEVNRLTYADLELDEARHEVHRAGRLVTLSPTEFALLRFLIRNAELVMSRGPDPRPRLALRLQRQLRGRGVLHQLPAPQGRQSRPTADPHHQGSRIRAEDPEHLMAVPTLGLSIRARLVLGMVLLVSVGLAVTNVAGILLMRSYLLDRVDSQVGAITPDAGESPLPDAPGSLCANPRDPQGLRSDFMLLVLDTDGDVACSLGPDIGDAAPELDQANLAGTDELATISSIDGEEQVARSCPLRQRLRPDHRPGGLAR